MKTLTAVMAEVWGNKALNTCWTYETLLLKKLPDNGTLMPKHEGVGDAYEVSCDLFYCTLIGGFFGCLKLLIVSNVSIAATCAQQ